MTRRLAAVVLTVSLALAPAPLIAAASKKQNAQDLLKDAQASIAYIAKGLKTAKVDPKAKANQPFMASLKDTEKHLAAAKKGLAAKNDDYYKALEQLRRSSNTLEITYSRSAIKDKQVSDGVKGVLSAVSELNKHYSKEAARLKKGGALSDAEKSKLTALQGQQKEFAAKMAQLESKLANDPKVDKDFKQKVSQMRAKATAASTSSPSVASLTDTLLLVGDLAGWWDGLSYYTPPSYRDSWVSIDDGYIDKWDTAYADTIVLVEVPTDWTYYDTPVALEPDYYEVSIPDTELVSYEEYVTNINITIPAGDNDRVGYAEDVGASIEDIDAREAATDADRYDLDSELSEEADHGGGDHDADDDSGNDDGDNGGDDDGGGND